MCSSCRPHVDVHKGGGPTHGDLCGQGEGVKNPDFLVEVKMDTQKTLSASCLILYTMEEWLVLPVTCVFLSTWSSQICINFMKIYFNNVSAAFKTI